MNVTQIRTAISTATDDVAFSGAVFRDAVRDGGDPMTLLEVHDALHAIGSNLDAIPELRDPARAAELATARTELGSAADHAGKAAVALHDGTGGTEHARAALGHMSNSYEALLSAKPAASLREQFLTPPVVLGASGLTAVVGGIYVTDLLASRDH